MPKSSSASGFASAADVAACRALLRGGSRTFFAASLVLPLGVRKPATGLYAFCRMADDAIDQQVDRAAALRELHARLEAIYAGTPSDIAADRAFGDCVSRHAIPQALPLALLEGFAWDAEGRRYQTLSNLMCYAVRVAGSVGVMMAMAMGVRDSIALARACDLGVAMQLTNIARDVGEDARCGRLYLPLDWLLEAGIEPQAWLAKPRFSSALGTVIERLLNSAEQLYARSEAGLARLPAACRPGMNAARLLYAEIGHEVARRKYDSVSQRAVVPWQRKARILADALFAATARPSAADAGALHEAQFLLAPLPTAVLEPPLPIESARERTRWPRIEDRVIWLVDLFERLERRERLPVGGIRT
ncbi:MAG TPA: phytoene/squalene synthase family protein [Steroidobacteraceae bacterium]